MFQKVARNLNARIAATRPCTSESIWLICPDGWVQFSVCRIAGISSSHNFALSKVCGRSQEVVADQLATSIISCWAALCPNATPAIETVTIETGARKQRIER